MIVMSHKEQVLNIDMLFLALNAFLVVVGLLWAVTQSATVVNILYPRLYEYTCIFACFGNPTTPPTSKAAFYCIWH